MIEKANADDDDTDEPEFDVTGADDADIGDEGWFEGCLRRLSLISY